MLVTVIDSYWTPCESKKYLKSTRRIIITNEGKYLGNSTISYIEAASGEKNFMKQIFMSRIFASSYRDPYPDTPSGALVNIPLPLKEGYKIRFLEDSGVSFRSLDIDVSVIYVLKFKV